MYCRLRSPFVLYQIRPTRLDRTILCRGTLLITGHPNFSNWIADGDEIRGRKWDDALRE